MCGIAGLVAKQNPSNAAEILQQMSSKIAHRGPDSEGSLWLENNSVGLAHRRLAIIDLTTAAAQPMTVLERYHLIFNGEIYNYLEIKTDLESKGYTFSSQSDAEVLLQAYAHYGENCLSHFDGMWAFAIYDARKKTIFCARDPRGVKPFYFVNTPQHFGFASEIKALLEIPSYKCQINPKAIQEFLAQAQIETQPEGFFKGIFELQPGQQLSYAVNNHQYQLAYFTHYKEEFNDLNTALQIAIQRRLRADVPIGICLSGGLDSSTLLALSEQILKKTDRLNAAELLAFTAVNDSPLDERKWAEQMIQKSEANWIQKEVTAKDFIASIQQIIYHQDIPILSASTYAQSAVMQAVSEKNIKIVLDGQGGDELFAGYQVFYPTYFKELFWKGKWARLQKEWQHLDNSPTTSKYIIKEWGQDVLSYLPIGLQKLIYKRKKVAYRYLKNPSLAKRTRFNSLQKHLKAYREGPALKGLLRWEDRCSMQYGIESRTPFTDALYLADLIEKFPADKLIQDGWSKLALRQEVSRQLPQTLTWRKDKKGFSVPQGAWLKETKNYWIELLNTKYILDPFDFLDWKKLQKEAPMILDQGTENEAQAFIFRCCSYLLWLEIFKLGKAAASI
ncbi:MAG: asparagine synthase [Bacteroidota bacterium]|jgi:asparagine synthase (glutamine-hydrolysing)